MRRAIACVTFGLLRHRTGTSLAGGKSIFIGTCQGLGIYCNTAGRPWIRPELIKCQPLGLTNEMGPREKLYERLPALKLQLRAKKEFL